MPDGTYTMTVSACDQMGNYNIVEQGFTISHQQTGVKDRGLPVNQFAIFPNPVDEGRVSLRIVIDHPMQDAELNLYNANGQLLYNLYKGSLDRGTNELNISLDEGSTAGSYFIQLYHGAEGVNLVKPLVVL